MNQATNSSTSLLPLVTILMNVPVSSHKWVCFCISSRDMFTLIVCTNNCFLLQKTKEMNPRTWQSEHSMESQLHSLFRSAAVSSLSTTFQTSPNQSLFKFFPLDLGLKVCTEELRAVVWAFYTHLILYICLQRSGAKFIPSRNLLVAASEVGKCNKLHNNLQSLWSWRVHCILMIFL
jgi:hypothetical protein